MIWLEAKPFTRAADPDKIIAAVKRGHPALDSIHSSDLAGVKSVRKAPRVWQGRLGLAAVAQILK